MYLLTKQIDDTVLYWQVWEYNGLLIEMQGEVGNIGFGKKTPLATIKDVDFHMETLASKKRMQGYDFFHKGESHLLLIQIPLSIEDTAKKEEIIHKAVNGLNLALQWSGNGIVTSTEISKGVLELRCEVIDTKAARASIEKTYKSLEIEGDYVLCYDDVETYDKLQELKAAY